MKSNIKRIAVYGTLREGHYNFEKFKRMFPELKVIKKNEKLKGYDLYSLGGYPGIKRGNGEVEVDILECSTKCFGAINYMELNAGYSVVEIFINNEPTYIYEYLGNVNPSKKIDSGNWNYKN
jgi:gamma-glutamylcyclotransferase (GGCT)/AIG2-like uncharacterized protein YtfP